MSYKLYEVYTSRGQLLLTGEAEVCAKFMSMDISSFYSHIQAHRKFGTITNRGYYAIVSGEAVEKEITRLIVYRVKKDILVPKKMKNGLMKLVKIKKREVYKWDYLINNGYIYLAKEITSKDNIRSYKDVIKVKKDVLEKYFERCKV